VRILFFAFNHRAAAALRALSLRCALVIFLARAVPPALPAFSAISLRRSGVSAADRAFAIADHGVDQYERRRTPMIEGSPTVEVGVEGLPSILSATPAADLDTSSAEVLSASQVRCFMDCQLRWGFKYGLKVPDPATANMALGRAVHSSLGENFAQKVDTREDLPTEGVVALFREAWANEIEQAEFRDEEDPKEFAATGEALVTKYMDQMAPTIDPAAVGLKLDSEIAGIKVRGWIDLLDVEGRVIDIKTAKARPIAVEPMHKFQVATYAHLVPGASGEGRVDTLVKTKVPQVISQSFHITVEEMKVTQTLYPAAQEAMRQQRFMPNRLSMMCSRRNCSCWRHCEREWGGEVPQT
jgi:CRISPR/Cas system-associated exonuclease Cas4 (RecB family)